jgi:glycosyltransferase involved in cell wall biosynthesis
VAGSRVLRIVARTNVGGPALQVCALTTGLDRTRFETRLLVGYVEPDEADYLDLRASDTPHVRVAGLGRSVRPADDLRALRAIVAEIRAFRPDIVHTHTAKAGVLGRVAARWCRVPVTVHTFHGHLLQGYFSRPKTRAVIEVERALARRTTTLAVVGTRVRDDLLAAGIGRPDQYVVVPPGVPTPKQPDKDVARADLGLPADAPVVAFVARMTAIKRPDRFAAVAHEVAARRPDAHFVVAGSGALLDDLRARTADLGARAHFLGWQSDVGAVYRAADVVVLTSDNEGMPVSLIEAAMCERPAVTTDVGSASDVVIDSETGFVTSLQSGDIAAAVVRLLDEPDLAQKIGDAAGRRARESFGVSRLVADTERIYERALENVVVRRAHARRGPSPT